MDTKLYIFYNNELIYMIKKEKLLNYFLSIGFILFLTIFLSVVVIMSRVVLSGATPISSHVQSTQNLLENIEEVQKAANLNVQENINSSVPLKRVRESYSSFNELGVEIAEISYFNSKQDNSVISISFDGKVGSQDGIYYLEKNISELVKGDFVAFKSNGILKTGRFLIVNNNLIHISAEADVMKINENQLLGKIFYIESNE